MFYFAQKQHVILGNLYLKTESFLEILCFYNTHRYTCNENIKYNFAKVLRTGLVKWPLLDFHSFHLMQDVCWLKWTNSVVSIGLQDLRFSITKLVILTVELIHNTKRRKAKLEQDVWIYNLSTYAHLRLHEYKYCNQLRYMMRLHGVECIDNGQKL